MADKTTPQRYHRLNGKIQILDCRMATTADGKRRIWINDCFSPDKNCKVQFNNGQTVLDIDAEEPSDQKTKAARLYKIDRYANLLEKAGYDTAENDPISTPLVEGDIIEDLEMTYDSQRHCVYVD